MPELFLDKAIVLLSGGLDSAVCLWWAKQKRWDLTALTFNYYRRTPREIQAANRLASIAEIRKHVKIDLAFLRELEDAELHPHHPLHRNRDKIPSVYIPARNAIFYSVAAYQAELEGARWIVGGHNSVDHKALPDSTVQFFKTMNKLFTVGTWLPAGKSVRILTPLASLNKSEILKLALELDVPVGETWSCQMHVETACGRCPACVTRLNAFHSLGVQDPIKYSEPWLSSEISVA